MIDRIEMTIEGEFPPIGKTLAVGQRPGVTSHSYTADSYRLFGDGADYDLKLHTLKTGGQVLDIGFCPPKILQGHNGLGSNDLRGVARHAVERIFQDRRIPLTPAVKERLRTGDYRLREVHVAELHSMPHASIPALCSAIRRYSPDSLQAVPLEKGIGVRLWPNSRSRNIMIYDKLHYFNDVTARKPERDRYLEMASPLNDSISRVEVPGCLHEHCEAPLVIEDRVCIFIERVEQQDLVRLGFDLLYSFKSIVTRQTD